MKTIHNMRRRGCDVKEFEAEERSKKELGLGEPFFRLLSKAFRC